MAGTGSHDNQCPECGRDIDRLGGNPECPACAAEPDAQGNPPQAVLDALAVACDECGHPGLDHLNAHDLTGPAQALVFAQATCWAENVCRSCAPDLYRRVQATMATGSSR